MHLLIGAKPGLLSTFFSLVKKRFCSPELKHCLNVYSVLLCTLGSYPVPTKFTLYAFIAHGYDWSGKIILETENVHVCSKYAITFTWITIISK